MYALALSGWGQPADAISNVCPPETAYFNYADYDSVDHCFDDLNAHREVEVAIGWSLGGQILVRAIAAGVIRPKKLVLLAAPFQCAADNHFPLGTPLAMLQASRMAFMENADAMLQQFAAFLAMGDSEPQRIVRELMNHRAVTQGQNWLFWFDELVRFSCRTLDFAGFPETHIIHGDQDAVIRLPQGEAFAAAIKNSKLHVLKGCGHVPHWHDASFVRRVINEM